MSADLDHTIVHVRNRHAAAAHVVEMLNLEPAGDYGPFAMVRLGNQAVLAFADTLGRPRQGHFAFLVDPAEFEQIRQRLPTTGSRRTPTRATAKKGSTSRAPKAAAGSTGTTRTATP